MTLSGLIVIERVGLLKRMNSKSCFAHERTNLGNKYVIVVGANHMTWLYARMVREFAASDIRIVGIVDVDNSLLGRSIAGHPIIGKLADLHFLLEDYAIHGIHIAKIVLTTRDGELSSEQDETVNSVSALRNIELNTLGHLLSDFPTGDDDESTSVEAIPWFEPVQSRSIWQFKRLLDIAIAAPLLILSAPFFVIVALLVTADVGFPVLFWQHRVGKNGEWLRLYKFRTMASAHSDHGKRKPDEMRLSYIGRALRASRLDELPQLWNILRGDMSIVGPRPLLPVDQPKSTSLRLCVKPGLTGWAQINGGKMVSIDEKDALDEWYIYNATLALDLKIILRTAVMMIWGETRDEAAIALALRDKIITSSPVTFATSDAGQSDSNGSEPRGLDLSGSKY